MNFVIIPRKVISATWKFAISCQSDGTIAFCKEDPDDPLNWSESYGTQCSAYVLIDITGSIHDCFGDIAKELNKFPEMISHVTSHLSGLSGDLNVM